jgi:hypothetical protein
MSKQDCPPDAIAVRPRAAAGFDEPLGGSNFAAAPANPPITPASAAFLSSGGRRA